MSKYQPVGWTKKVCDEMASREILEKVGENEFRSNARFGRMKILFRPDLPGLPVR